MYKYKKGICKMKLIPFENTTITGGFWAEKQKMVRNVSIHSIYERFSDTGRFAAFDFGWKEGMPNRPHIFWDSDVAKWLESAAFLIAKEPEPELKAIVDEVVGKIVAHQDKCGYFNIYFTVVEPTERFKRRGDHELYCAGHLIVHTQENPRLFRDLRLQLTGLQTTRITSSTN
jgi:DUF1680 family protein